MYKKVLLTGGTGLLGKAVMAVRGDYPDTEFIPIGSRDCDLTNVEATIAFVDALRPDAVLHAAAAAGGVQYSRRHPATLLRDNVLMNLSVLEAARACGVRKTILTLSTGMYATDAPNPIKEDYIH